MKIKNFKIFFLILLAFSLNACSESWEESGLYQNSVPIAASQGITLPKDIELFVGATADQPYDILREVKVAVNKTTAFNIDPTVAQVETRLRETAAYLGGDAVINVLISDVKIRFVSWGGRTGTGEVIKY